MTAANHEGLFSLREAKAASVSARDLERWVAQGWIDAVRYGVYAFAGAPPSRWRPTVAAALAAGDDATISHLTAGVIHGFHGLAMPSTPELIVPRSPRRRLDRVRLHFTGPVEAQDRTIRRGVSVTSPVRTLLDLAPYLQPELLGKILDEGAVGARWSFEEVEACVSRQPRRRIGGPTLRRLLVSRLGEARPDSPLEQRVIRYLWPLGPFEVHYQVILDGSIFLLDVAWPWWKVAAEIDGRSYRALSRSTHDRESHKLTLLTAADWKVAHLTSTMSADECITAVCSLLPADQRLPRDRPLRKGRKRGPN